MKFTVEELKLATNAEVKGSLNGEFEISTDTRTIKKGDLYLPLKGANFDGENFCDKAIEAGAVGCFCTKDDCYWKFWKNNNKGNGLFCFVRKIQNSQNLF